MVWPKHQYRGNVTVQDISRAIADVTGASDYPEEEKKHIEKRWMNCWKVLRQWRQTIRTIPANDKAVTTHTGAERSMVDKSLYKLPVQREQAIDNMHYMIAQAFSKPRFSCAV